MVAEDPGSSANILGEFATSIWADKIGTPEIDAFITLDFGHFSQTQQMGKTAARQSLDS